jgi:hypothetical protein
MIDLVQQLVSQVSRAMNEIRAKNLNLNFILIGVNASGNMCTTSSPGVSDPLTRICLLSEAVKADAQHLQQKLQQAAQAEAVRLVQQSTEKMTKQ